MLNRTAIILKYKAPAIQWINETDPYNDDPGIDAESVNDERTVYLISDEDGDSPDTIKCWIDLNWRELFEQELEGWYTDPSLWPKNLSLKLFREWFTVEYHTCLVDTVGTEFYDDDI